MSENWDIDEHSEQVKINRETYLNELKKLAPFEAKERAKTNKP